MLTLNWIQHALGHGGFHTGHARTDNDLQFNWIFDCGARRTERFDAYLRAWTDHHQWPVDWLFISHFDTDHVSGLDTLMSRAVVRDVMVPYVNERELAYTLLYEISRGNLDRAFVELVADPAAFLLSRGAERVTFLRGRRPDGGLIEDGPRPERPKDGQGWITKSRPLPRPLQAPYWARIARGAAARMDSADRVRLIDGGECDIGVTRGPVGLLLKPYRAPIQPYLHRGLTKTLQALVGPLPWKQMRPGLGDLAYAIAHHARTAKGRAGLRSIFRLYVGSSNRASMSLLSIPVVEDESNARWEVVRPYGHSMGRGKPAWLNTGDAELLRPDDLQYWQAAYAHQLAQVRVLALPHHGSDKNSSIDLQTLCPNAVLTAHVKSDAKKHPGAAVAEAAGVRLASVTEQPATEVRMWFCAP